MTAFNMIRFIERKSDCGKHTGEELHTFVDSVMRGTVPDYQISAWLMAAFLNGLDDDELMHFTKSLALSGETISYQPEDRIIDKHSTGGVGDKTTLILVPLVAACGSRISKLSGPGLGFTGGTIDKLESIPGMDMHLSDDRFRADNTIDAQSRAFTQAAPRGKFTTEGRHWHVPSIPSITASYHKNSRVGIRYLSTQCARPSSMRGQGNLRQNLHVSKKLGRLLSV
jgi:pyrimidine-nucleoside phosphorylase